MSGDFEDTERDELESKTDYNSTQLVKMIIRKPIATTQISLLIESLVKNLCTMIETDKERALKIYDIICTKLFDMKLIDESFRMNEFEGMRNQYQEALYHLVTVARGGDEPIKVKRVWSCEEMNLRSSHYYREFDEIEYIAGGGFGQVFRVRHKLDGSEYAIKKISIRSSGIDSVMNYLAEVKTFASLNHPNIVQYKAAWLELGSSVDTHAIEAASSLTDTGSLFSRQSDGYIYPGVISSLESERLSVHAHHSEFTVKFEEGSVCDRQYSFSNNNIRSSRRRSQSRESRNSISEGGQAMCKFDIEQYDGRRPRWATLYIQMALCQITLKQWLEKRNLQEFGGGESALVKLKCKVRKDTVLEILRQTLRGIQYIHSKGIVHHDIKPSNIFMQVENGVFCVQLGDFGLACPLQNTRHSLACGTKLYAAPEQRAGKCDPKSDMFSLGIVLLELVETFHTDMERVHNIMKLREGNLSSQITAQEPQLAHIISQLVSRYPQDRPDATQLLERLTVQPDDSEQVRNLKTKLAEKDSEISRLKEMLKSAGVDV